MWSAATVLVCVLSVLGRSAHSLPPIAFVDVPPPGVSPQAEAFIQRPGTIYLITSSSAFHWAQRSSRRCGDTAALTKLASIIVHEEWHVQHGPDERGAYLAQLMALRTLGVNPDTPLFHSVQRSMNAVLKAQRATPPTTIVASAGPSFDP